ncbi:hypothetical protein IE81DRAFT_326007 [Ceraceosorus guamensis]|uniref:Uncharacterized protein n=1 Tax=Ceraceosorus guamensis TaxID=1522189 RepID=A0A316VQN8_9BASI|nr:hypothetical protein IE81DRAFT_326007 [Ceraceosorus guamensis]PWN39959.1 hypothetical protein IE81DRAFT_326007 [Ceraceosorus guamensis]
MGSSNCTERLRRMESAEIPNQGEESWLHLRFIRPAWRSSVLLLLVARLLPLLHSFLEHRASDSTEHCVLNTFASTAASLLALSTAVVAAHTARAGSSVAASLSASMLVATLLAGIVPAFGIPALQVGL